MVHEPPILKKNAYTTLIGASKDLAILTITGEKTPRIYHRNKVQPAD